MLSSVALCSLFDSYASFSTGTNAQQQPMHIEFHGDPLGAGSVDANVSAVINLLSFALFKILFATAYRLWQEMSLSASVPLHALPS